MRLFEFGDLGWVPSWYQINLRKYLIFFYKLFGYFKLWLPAMSEFVEKNDSDSYLELGSGGGEVLRMVVSELPPKMVSGKRFVMSDINPVPEFVEQVNSRADSPFTYYPSPVDATSIPNKLSYPKIFINSFHHFSPEQVGIVVGSSMQAGQPILILEYVRNSLLGYLSMVFGPIVILLTLPLVIAPKQLPVMLVFTYLLPIFPLMMLWDGIVSCLRAYGSESIERILEDTAIPATITSYTKRSLFYPAGVTTTIILPS